MIKIKKTIFFIIKSLLTLVALLTLVLFFYAAFYYEPSAVERKITEAEIKKNEEPSDLQSSQKPESDVTEDATDVPKVEDVTDTPKVEEVIQDGLFVIVGNRAITKSDIVNEIKIILILNNMIYSSDLREELQDLAIKSAVKRTVKEIEINKNNFLEFSQDDFDNELNRLANNLNMDIDTLKNVCISNGLDFSIIKDQIKTELLWNSLIFALYRNRVSINLNEIDEQLKLYQDKKEFGEFLISEIIIKPVEKDKLESRIEEIKNKIKAEGFENAAMNLSISQSAIKGGDLGWLSENEISKKFRSIILNTSIGSLSEPILLNEGILIFMVRDKRIVEKEINLVELKNKLVESEKQKILNMYSMSHYDNLRRSISIKFFDE